MVGSSVTGQRERRRVRSAAAKHSNVHIGSVDAQPVTIQQSSGGQQLRKSVGLATRDSTYYERNP